MIELKNALLIAASILIVSPSFSQGYEKLSEDKVDQNKVKLAKNFADSYLCAARDGKTYEFQANATEVLSKSFTPELQKQVYNDMQSKYGDYKSLEYAESWQYAGPQNMTIVRLKGIFGNNTVKPEIRVVMDEANKVAGFWYKPWEDELK